MSAEMHRKKLHELVDMPASNALLERLEMLLSSVISTNSEGNADPTMVKEIEARYNIPLKGRLHK
ncbi:hypothetical protein BH09BAC1_BH09BAC1_11650 [soil metagenome]